jgi:hypothetical protein
MVPGCGFMRIVASSVLQLRAPIPRDIKVAGPDADPCLSRSFLDRDVVQRARARRTNESAPKAGALPKFNRPVPQAATLVGLTSRSLLELAIGIDRGFMASGISRTRSTCRSPFSRLARDPAILRQRGGEVDPIIGCSPETPARPTSRLARGNREGLFNPRLGLADC